MSDIVEVLRDATINGELRVLSRVTEWGARVRWTVSTEDRVLVFDHSRDAAAALVTGDDAGEETT